MSLYKVVQHAIGQYSLTYDGVVTLGTSVTVGIFTPFRSLPFQRIIELPWSLPHLLFTVVLEKLYIIPINIWALIYW